MRISNFFTLEFRFLWVIYADSTVKYWGPRNGNLNVPCSEPRKIQFIHKKVQSETLHIVSSLFSILHKVTSMSILIKFSFLLEDTL